MKTLDIIQGFCDHVFRDKKGNRIFPNIFVGKWEADLLEVTRSRLTYEYEVKVSRCDFHKDKKKSDKYGKNKFDVVTSGQRTNYFYYECPQMSKLAKFKQPMYPQEQNLQPFHVRQLKGNTMNLLDFYRQYPDESSCKDALRHFREHHGLFCSRCGGLRLSWNPSHRSWTCMDCKHEMTLRSGTVMQGSNLPIRDWFAAMYLLTATKRAISTKEIQRQLGRKRYQPVWEMAHKLRDVMGKRDARYNLHGDVEIDEGFFSTETPEDQKDCPLKRGRGSQRKTSVLVMAESGFPDTPSDKKRSTPKVVGHIKMEVIDDLKASTETPKIKQATDGKVNATTDGSNTYASLEKDGAVASHKAVVMDDKKKVGKVLPWVHIAISNAKRSILDTYHDINAEFLQLYLNEFCYKFNRRYFGFRLFERLELCACTYRAEFKHRIY